MKIFFDTEFIEDGRTIELISIGLVRDDGAELYREVDPVEVPWDRAHDWVLENVKPHLLNSKGQGRDVVKSKSDIAYEIVQFVGKNPEFWAYFCSYDWVVLCQLYGMMVNLPATWPMYCNDLKQVLGRFTKMPIPMTGTAHNALDDARWLRNNYVKVMEQRQSVTSR